jgi:hypothetical protein
MATEDNTIVTPEALVEQLRALLLHIPEYAQLTVPNAALLRSAAAANREFVQAAINTVGASPSVQSALGVAPLAMRTEADDVLRWSAVEDQLRAMLKGVAAANLTRRHRLGLTALQAYTISRSLVRKAEHAGLLPYVAEMKRANRFGRKPAKPVVPELKKPTTPTA